MIDDVARDYRSRLRLPNGQALSSAQLQQCYYEALYRLDDAIRTQGTGKTLASFPSIPSPPPRQHHLIQDELDRYDQPTLLAYIGEKERLLNRGQRAMYDRIVGAVNSNLQSANVFFVDSPGGGGKTFTTNLLLAKVRSQNAIALACASSGIAALLLDGGVTAHSRFTLPIPIGEGAMCNIKAQSDKAKLLREAKLIVWDEAPMTHRHCFEAVDRTMRDLFSGIAGEEWRQNVAFGGKVRI